MNTQNHISDRERIFFVEQRDGARGALDFATRCVNIYRRTALNYKKDQGRHYFARHEFIESYLFHKKYVREKHHEHRY